MEEIEKREISQRSHIQLGFFGLLGARKGIFDLLQAMLILKETGKFTLAVCGDGVIEKVRKKVEELNLKDIVKIHGWTAGEDKIRIMNECDSIVLPSYNEGLPMVILEGMSLSKVVISTNVGGIPEVINDNDNGYLIEPGDIDMLVSKISALSDKEKSQDIANNARSTYERSFSPDAIIPKLESIYKELGMVDA